jgi:hypothetical protein
MFGLTLFCLCLNFLHTFTCIFFTVLLNVCFIIVFFLFCFNFISFQLHNINLSVPNYWVWWIKHTCWWEKTKHFHWIMVLCYHDEIYKMLMDTSLSEFILNSVLIETFHDYILLTRNTIHSWSQSQSYFTTDSMSPLWDLPTDITSCQYVVWNLRSCFSGAPSLTRARVCNLQCNHSMVQVAQNP